MNKLDLQKIEDTFSDYSLSIDAKICGSCRAYKIAMQLHKGSGRPIFLDINQVYNNFTININSGLIKDFLEFKDSCINTELMNILNKVIK